jgi:hypothetical protein
VLELKLVQERSTVPDEADPELSDIMKSIPEGRTVGFEYPLPPTTPELHAYHKMFEDDSWS